LKSPKCILFILPPLPFLLYIFMAGLKVRTTSFAPPFSPFPFFCF